MFSMFVVIVALASCKSYCCFFIYWFRIHSCRIAT